MKKSKMAVKKGASKINPKKKPVAAGKTSKKKPAHKSAIKKAVKKPVVKMAAKAKKPQVKIQSKPAKPAPKTTPKQLEKKNNKVLAKPTSKPSAKPSVPEKPVAAPKGGKGAPAQAVAAVLTKGAAKAPKAPKVSASSERMCREASCENVATTKGYCRLDYIKNWKKIKRKEMILKEGKLNQYIEELVGKYPDKYIDIIRQDLSSELSFNKVIHDLELDESIDDLEYDGDSIDALIGGIKKDIEDIGEDEF